MINVSTSFVLTFSTHRAKGLHSLQSNHDRKLLLCYILAVLWSSPWDQSQDRTPFNSLISLNIVWINTENTASARDCTCFPNKFKCAEIKVDRWYRWVLWILQKNKRRQFHRCLECPCCDDGRKKYQTIVDKLIVAESSLPDLPVALQHPNEEFLVVAKYSLPELIFPEMVKTYCDHATSQIHVYTDGSCKLVLQHTV